MKNRTFFLGLILSAFGLLGLSDHITELKTQTWVFSAWNVLSFICDCGLIYFGFIKVNDTTK